MSDSEDDLPTGSTGEVAEPPVGSPDPTAMLVAPRGRRGPIQKAMRDELGMIWEFESLDPTRRVAVALRGKAIGTTAGAAEAIGETLHRLGRFLRELGNGDVYVESLAFANSVHITLRPSEREIEESLRELERARELNRAGNEKARQALAAAVPDVQLAAALAAELFSARAADVPEKAAAFGTSVAAAYKSLAATLYRYGLRLELASPERATPARVSADKAGRIYEELRTAMEPQRFIETVVGTLSIANAIKNGFGLQLDPGGERPFLLRRKSLVRGTYTPEVEDKIRDQALWDKRVRATIEITRDARISTSRIRPPTFLLVDVEEETQYLRRRARINDS